jgi:hypothetical protein
MRARDKERLILGAVCALAVALALAGRDGRFGETFERHSWTFVGVTAGLLIKSFLPEPEKWDALSYGIRLAVWLIAILALILLFSALGGFVGLGP